MGNVSVEEKTTQSNTDIQAQTQTIHSFKEDTKEGKETMKKIVVVAIVVALGTATGYFLSNVSAGSPFSITSGGANKVIKTGKIVGSTDSKTFRDQAEGKLEKGGFEGEGTHKLIRDPKRPDQTVYLISSVVDLDQFVGKKVRVWGETNTAQKAGWFMDVGKVETL